MISYFVSYSYISQGGQPLFGNATITTSGEINTLADISRIQKQLSRGDYVHNVMILNIQKLPI